jgi:hypothetical protein
MEEEVQEEACSCFVFVVVLCGMGVDWIDQRVQSV